MSSAQHPSWSVLWAPLLASESAQWRKVEQPWNWQLDSTGQFHEQDYVCVPCAHWIEQHSCLLAYCASLSGSCVSWVKLSLSCSLTCICTGTKTHVYGWSAFFHVKSLLMSFSVLAPWCGYCGVCIYVFTIKSQLAWMFLPWRCYILIFNWYVSRLFFGLLPDFDMYYSPISLTFLSPMCRALQFKLSQCTELSTTHSVAWRNNSAVLCSLPHPTLPATWQCTYHCNIVTL